MLRKLFHSFKRICRDNQDSKQHAIEQDNVEWKKGFNSTQSDVQIIFVYGDVCMYIRVMQNAEYQGDHMPH